jgi:NMD protein affecting ribosome stability and mRNA decay
MDTPRQADLFEGDPDARECVSCGDSFVPDWDSDKLCDDCYERKQRRPQKNASDAELME